MISIGEWRVIKHPAFLAQRDNPKTLIIYVSKQMYDATDSSDRPATQTDQIEITPQMIEAGLAVYVGHCPDTACGDRLDREMIAEIFAAMSRQGYTAPASTKS